MELKFRLKKVNILPCRLFLSSTPAGLVSSVCCVVKFWSYVDGRRPGCRDVAHHAAECSSGLEQRAGALPAPPPLFFLPLFASGTQLPHLTFSIWPLPRGEIAGASKRGCHTSWILLSFNLPPRWCTWIMNEDIAQLRGFLRSLPRYCSYFCAAPGFWCIMDMDIGFVACAMLWHCHSPEDKKRRGGGGTRLVGGGGWTCLPRRVQGTQSVSLPLQLLCIY